MGIGRVEFPINDGWFLVILSFAVAIDQNRIILQSLNGVRGRGNTTFAHQVFAGDQGFGKRPDPCDWFVLRRRALLDFLQLGHPMKRGRCRRAGDCTEAKEQ